MAMVACNSSGSTTTRGVTASDAIVAIVAWQTSEMPPRSDASGETQLPVIFVVADDGATLDVGVQADVARATVDMATVRFADDIDDTFDPDVVDEPVRDEGVLLLVGPVPDPSRTITVAVERYQAIDDRQALQLEIVATAGADAAGPRARVTSATPL